MVVHQVGAEVMLFREKVEGMRWFHCDVVVGRVEGEEGIVQGHSHLEVRMVVVEKEGEKVGLLQVEQHPCGRLKQQRMG